MQTEAENNRLKKSTKDKIKEMFLAGHIMTSCDAAGEFVTADLRKYVSMLKREGLDIIGEWMKSENGKHFKKYWLKKEQSKIITIPITEQPITPGQQ